MGVTIARVYAGDGYQYLVQQVAMGDERRKSTRLADYYSQRGEQPGQWLGAGLAHLAGGAGLAGEVTAEHMERLIGRGVDPVTGGALGRAFTLAAQPGKRAVLAAAATRREGGSADILLDAVRELPRGVKRPSVAAFDLTCEAPKSVSILWALASDDVREEIEVAQAAAVRAVVAFIEADVVKSRVGAGGVGQVDVAGVAAAAYVHHESRAVDPHLHTHLVVSNKVTAADGRWRSIDSQALYFAVVAASETYNAVLQDELSRRLGVGWRDREVSRGKRTTRELVGVPDVLVDAFSTRRAQIAPRLAELTAAFAARTGRAPSRSEAEQLSHLAWREGRPEKNGQRASLREFFDVWAETAQQLLRTRPEQMVARVLAGGGRVVRTSDVGVERVAAAVVDEVSRTRSTWTVRHLQAEAQRQTADVRCTSVAEREQLVAGVVDAAVRSAIALAAPPRVAEPSLLQRADGVSVFIRHKADRYTTRQVLDAEASILTVAHAPAARHLQLDPRLVDAVLSSTGRPLGPDQAAAVRQVATDGRAVSVVIGPAGTGKSTTMSALVAVWAAGHGPGRVVAAAPSAAAAQVLTDSLVSAVDAGVVVRGGGRTSGPVTAQTLDSLALALSGSRLRLEPGDLVILDEAGMAPTLLLAEVTRHVATAGAKLLLVGDDAQLGAVAAGGALRMLADTDRTPVATLDGVWRFTDPWERDATLRLRAGDAAAIGEYASRGRLLEGDASFMLDAAYEAWTADEAASRTSLLIAADNATVDALNARARADRVAAGIVAADGVGLPGSGVVGVGDRVLTRKNTREVQVLKGVDCVRNGDTWDVTTTHADGSLAVRHTRHGGRATLPADYVRQHVQLGYASTAHRAQGSTVDTAHLILTAALVRETAYVGMTRGRHANTAYVVTGDLDHGPETHQPPWAAGEPLTGAEVWAAVLATPGAEQAAHTVMAEELAASGTLATLAPRYEFAAQQWHALGWPALVDDVLVTVRGLTPDLYPALQAPPGSPWSVSPALVALASTLSAAGRQGLDPELLLRKAAMSQGLAPSDGVHDPVAVLQARLETLVEATEPRPRPWIAGVTPRVATSSMPGPVGELGEYLASLEVAMEARADEVALAAIASDASWLPSVPRSLVRLSATRRASVVAAEPREADVQRWWAGVRQVAAYRDLAGTPDPLRALGPDVDPLSSVGRARARAETAMLTATSHRLDLPVVPRDAVPVVAVPAAWGRAHIATEFEIT